MPSIAFTGAPPRTSCCSPSPLLAAVLWPVALTVIIAAQQREGRVTEATAAGAAGDANGPVVLSTAERRPIPPGGVSPWLERSAGSLAASLRAGEVTSVELTDQCLRQLDALNPRLNAVVVPLAASARAAAKAADEALRDGTAPPADSVAGRLWGVPIVIKECSRPQGSPLAAACTGAGRRAGAGAGAGVAAAGGGGRAGLRDGGAAARVRAGDPGAGEHERGVHVVRVGQLSTAARATPTTCSTARGSVEAARRRWRRVAAPCVTGGVGGSAHPRLVLRPLRPQARRRRRQQRRHLSTRRRRRRPAPLPGK